MNNELTELKVEPEDRPVKAQPKPPVEPESPEKEAQPQPKVRKKRRTSLPPLIMLIVLVVMGYYFLNFLKHSQQVQHFLQTNLPNASAVNENTPKSENSQDVDVEPSVAISPIATQSAADYSDNQARLVIPGDVTDKIVEGASNIPEMDEAFDAITSGNTNAASLVLNSQLPEANFTIQLLSSDSLDDVLEFVKQNEVTNYHLYETKQDGRSIYRLIQGNYPNKASAEAALAEFSKKIPAVAFHIKTGFDVKNEKGQTANP